jgi:phytoene synthase
VAGSVGLMLLPVLSRRAAELTESAVGLGIAMQLTNILRDVGEDARMGRIYFPVSAMAAAGYPIERLKAEIVDEAFIHLWEGQAARAEALYDAFEARADLLDDDARPATLAALRMYRGILNVVRRNGYLCFDRRASLSSAERNRILSTFLPEESEGGDAEEALS